MIATRSNDDLSPFRLAHISIPEFPTELTNYLSVLNLSGSIAFGRGEDLTSIRLSKSLESLFSTAIPCVREGPPLTWTTIILFAPLYGPVAVDDWRIQCRFVRRGPQTPSLW
ncbi:unnamed protein product [Penicillium camemberti]|uniref:Str. FM013 n=1 Tax=Penicillium camemberti (strain FM 013) TaxID=1429867 RepID=A0A0G4PTM4_PENC3|nr:unnamed protein product [Penicillium camemberti]